MCIECDAEVAGALSSLENVKSLEHLHIRTTCREVRKLAAFYASSMNGSMLVDDAEVEADAIFNRFTLPDGNLNATLMVLAVSAAFYKLLSVLDKMFDNLSEEELALLQRSADGTEDPAEVGKKLAQFRAGRAAQDQKGKGSGYEH